MKTRIFNNNSKSEIYPNKHFTDSKGNKISIGDRVRVLWGFDNRIHVFLNIKTPVYPINFIFIFSNPGK